MNTSNRHGKYRQAIDRCILEIQEGTLKPGAAFYSRTELCRKFDISLATAHKVQRILQENLYILPYPGSKFIVADSSYFTTAEPQKLKRVRIIGDANAIKDDSFGGRIVSGIRLGCRQHGFEFEREFVHVLNTPPGYLNPHRRLAPDEGLIVLLHQDLAQEIISLLLNPTARVVTVNSYFSPRSSVLPDYRGAMKALLEEALSRGAKRVMYCSGYGLFPCPIIASERESAFQEYTERYKLAAMIENSGNYHLAAKAVTQFQPDTILYQNDSYALHFRNNYLTRCGIPVRVLGCDNYSEDPGLSTLTTWDTDPVGMGRVSVDVLANPCVINKPYVARVKGKIVIRD